MAHTRNEKNTAQDRGKILINYYAEREQVRYGPRIALLAALPQELKALQQLSDDKTLVNATGVGKAAAAACTQRVIDQFKASVIISVGTVGAIDDRLRVGDLGIVTAAIDADIDVRAWDSKYRRGQLPFTKNRVYRSNEDLVQKLRLCAPKTFDAYVASGSAFLDTEGKENFRKHLQELKDTRGSVCLPNLYDMETSAILQTADSNGIKCVALRVVSDTTKGDTAEQFNEFLGRCSKQYVKTIKRLIHDHLS